MLSCPSRTAKSRAGAVVIVKLATAFGVALPVVLLRLYGFTQCDVTGTAAAMMRQRGTIGLDVVKFCQPTRHIASHDIGMRAIVSPFAMDYQHVA